MFQLISFNIFFWMWVRPGRKMFLFFFVGLLYLHCASLAYVNRYHSISSLLLFWLTMIEKLASGQLWKKTWQRINLYVQASLKSTKTSICSTTIRILNAVSMYACNFKVLYAAATCQTTFLETRLFFTDSLSLKNCIDTLICILLSF